MGDHSTIISFIAEYWQIVFLYFFKYLRDIAETVKKLEIDIHVLKYANNIKDTNAKNAT